MDLQTVHRRITNHYYRDYSTFHRDILQIFWNGCTFNPCSDIWYQQCVVLKLCYMHIYEELCSQGIVDCLPEDQPYDDLIIRGEKEANHTVCCYTTASSPTCWTIAQNRKHIDQFVQKYFGDHEVSTTLVSYPLRRVTRDYAAGMLMKV